MALDWSLEYYFKIRGAHDTWNFRIFQKVGKKIGDNNFRLPIKNVNVRYSSPINIGPILHIPTPTIETSFDLRSFTWGGAKVGDSLYISNSTEFTSDFRVYYIEEFFDTGDGTYPYGIRFSQQLGNLEFDGETDTCDIYIEGAKKVECLNPRTKWGEEITIDDELTPKFEPLIISNTDLDLFDESGKDYEEIFSEDPGSFKLEIYKGATNYHTPFWVGLSLPDVFSRQVYGSNYLTSIRFNDGLALANRRRFYVDDPDTDMTWMETLVQCFTEGCRNPLQIRENFNVYETGMDDGLNDSPMDQATINPQRYYEPDKTFADPIINICTENAARVFQWEGRWVLQRIHELGGEYYYRTFSETGSFTTGSWTAGIPVEITKVYGDREGNFLQSQPASERVTITYDNPYKENFQQLNIITNGFFEKWTGNVPDGWTVYQGNNPTWSVSKTTDSETGRYAVDMETKTGYSGIPVSNNYLETTFGTGLGGYDLEIVLKRMNSETSSDQNRTDDILALWTADVDGYFWDAANGEWTTSQVFNEVDVAYYPLSPDYIHATFEINPENNHPTSLGNNAMRFRLYEINPQGTFGTTYVDRVTAKIIQTDEGKIRPEIEAPKLSSNRISSPIDKRNGDIDISIFMPLSPTKLWLERDAPFAAHTRKALGKVALDNIEAESNRQIYIATIDIKTPTMDLNDPIALSGDRYIHNGVELQYSLGRWSGQFVQIVSKPKYFKS